VLIEAGEIKQFKEIFSYIPRHPVVTALGTNSNRVKRIIEMPEEYPLKVFFAIAKLFEIDEEKMCELVRVQIEKKRTLPST
jgi:hypothetical protein